MSDVIKKSNEMTYAEAYFFLVAAMARDGIAMRVPVWPDDFYEWDEPVASF